MRHDLAPYPFRREHNRGQRIFDLMGELAGHFPPRGKLLGPYNMSNIIEGNNEPFNLI